jgi:hypothetical protein
MSINAMKLLIVLALICTPAWGQTFRFNNQGGGEVVLTNRWCKYNGKEYRPLLEVYSYDRSGETSQGCWEYVDNMIRIHWFTRSGLQTKIYPSDNLRYAE